MKRKYDYIALLEKQGSIALAPTESGAAESERCYVQMCKMLVADFLPPIAREDLAGLMSPACLCASAAMKGRTEKCG